MTHPGAADRADAPGFFADVTHHLQSVGAAHHVKHLVTVSIVGIERAPRSAYYAAKLRQEEIALSGTLPSTVLRATQFHEFPVQLLRRTRAGSSATVPRMRVRTVAARTVAEALVDLASGPAVGRTTDLAGPDEADLVTLARQYVQHFGLDLTVTDGAANPDVPYGATLPDAGARREGPTFAAWLVTPDAARLAE